MDCQFPVTGPSGHKAFFDIDAATPGDFIAPKLFDDEVWLRNSTAEMIWIYFKGDPETGSTPGHPFDGPYDDWTSFTIDLLRAATMDPPSATSCVSNFPPLLSLDLSTQLRLPKICSPFHFPHQ